MKSKMKKLTGIMMVALASVYLFSCSQTTNGDFTPTGKTGKVQVKMTDSVADFLAVNVEIKSISLHVVSDESETDSLDHEENDSLSYEQGDSVESESKDSVSGWYTLNTYSGVYNLLDFQNGKDTMLAFADIPAGKITQIRFELGDSNSIVTNLDTIMLTIPGSTQSGLKINVGKVLSSDEALTLLFDFNAGKSVVLSGNGEFILKPVIKLLN